MGWGLGGVVLLYTNHIYIYTYQIYLFIYFFCAFLTSAFGRPCVGPSFRTMPVRNVGPDVGLT